MKVFRVLGLMTLVVMVSAWPSNAQEGTWGVGAFANYNVPTFGFGDWYGNETKFGLSASYVPSSKVTVEVEFHRGSFSNGALETLPFTWTDGKEYTSPNAKSGLRNTCICPERQDTELSISVCSSGWERSIKPCKKGWGSHLVSMRHRR